MTHVCDTEEEDGAGQTESRERRWVRPAGSRKLEMGKMKTKPEIQGRWLETHQHQRRYCAGRAWPGLLALNAQVKQILPRYEQALHTRQLHVL